MVAAGLDCFLQGIKMNDDGVGADHFSSPHGFLAAVAKAKLGGAEIGIDRNSRRRRANRPSDAIVRPAFEGNPLRSDGEGNFVGLSCLRQALVDQARALRAAGH